MIPRLLLTTVVMLSSLQQLPTPLRLISAELKEPHQINLSLAYTPKATASEAQIYLNINEPVPFLKKVDIRIQKTIWNATQNFAFPRPSNAKPTKEYTYMFKDMFQMMPTPQIGETREYVVHIEAEDGRVTETKPFTILYTK